MIKIFNATDKDYTSNGDIVLQSIKAKVHYSIGGIKTNEKKSSMYCI